MAKLQRILLVSDQHIPYNDKRYWKLLLKVARKFKFKHIVIMGDFVDCFSVSHFPKDPNRIIGGLKAEIQAANKALDQLDALRIPNKYYLAGNHCDRLRIYLETKAPELFGIVEIDKLLHLKARGWKFTPYKEHIKIGKLFITHDCGKAGKDAHYQAVQNDFQANIAIAHTHRIGYCVVGNAKGSPHVGTMLGWGGDVKKIDYMHKIKALRDWALGFGMAYLENNGNVHVVPIPVVDYKVVIEGKLIK